MADKAVKSLKFDGTERLGIHKYKRQLLAVGGIKGRSDKVLTTSLLVVNPLAT